MKTLRYLLAVGLALASQPSAHALSVVIPDFAVEEAEYGQFFLRKLNQKSVIEIRRAKDLEVDWKVYVPNHDGAYSRLVLTSGGKYLVHLRSNFYVHEIDSVCLAVFSRDGGSHQYTVGDLMEKLVESENPSDFRPKYKWLEEVKFVRSTSLSIKLANGKTVSILFDKKKVNKSNSPSPERTVSWTYRKLTHATSPRVKFPKGTRIGEMIHTLQLECANPRANGIKINATEIADFQLDNALDFELSDYSLLYILTQVADAGGARLTVDRGFVNLERTSKKANPDPNRNGTE